jgi:PhnB protein
MTMLQLNAYLSFDGNCADAMRFYERVLGGKIQMMMTNAQGPMCDPMSPGNGDRIMHACLVLQQGVLMAGDAMPNRPYEGMKGFSLTLTYPTAAEARPIFEALSEGGQVSMPFAKAFWADGSGMVTDRFGTPWIVNGGLIDVQATLG